MKFSCEKTLLLSAILTASHVAAAKSSVPELEGLLIEARDGIVKISGYDLKTGIITSIDADVEENGGIVINSRLLCDIVRKLPDGFVTLEVSDSFLAKIECGMSEFNIMGIASHNYPELPIMDLEKSAKIPGGLLKEMIAQTNFAVSDNETRPVLTGSLFEIDKETITIIAVDGFRLALRRETVENSCEEPMSFVAPGSALNELEKISMGESDEILISLGSKHIMFSVENTVLLSRRLVGEFLNYRETIPQDGKYSVNVDRKMLIDSVERVSQIINDQQKSPLRFTFSDGVVKLQTVSSLGRAYDECPIEGAMDDIEIGFNNKYLLDALRAATADEVCFRVSSGITPCLILPTDDSNKFIHMILPVRLRTNEN
jgi:DNA polymerase-3 subunit beta